MVLFYRKHSDEPFFGDRFCDHTQFGDETTPLILAAQNNRYEIVMALLMKGQVSKTMVLSQKNMFVQY